MGIFQSCLNIQHLCCPQTAKFAAKLGGNLSTKDVHGRMEGVLEGFCKWSCNTCNTTKQWVLIMCWVQLNMVCSFVCLLGWLVGGLVSFSLFKDASSVGRVGCVFWRDWFTGTVFETRKLLMTWTCSVSHSESSWNTEKNKMYAANVGRATIMHEQNTVPEVSKNVKIQKDVQAMV